MYILNYFYKVDCTTQDNYYSATQKEINSKDAKDVFEKAVNVLYYITDNQINNHANNIQPEEQNPITIGSVMIHCINQNNSKPKIKIPFYKANADIESKINQMASKGLEERNKKFINQQNLKQVQQI